MSIEWSETEERYVQTGVIKPVLVCRYCGGTSWGLYVDFHRYIGDPTVITDEKGELIDVRYQDWGESLGDSLRMLECHHCQSKVPADNLTGAS